MKTRILLAAILALCGAAAHAGDPALGKEKSAACAGCHGADGNSQSADFPRLAGQHEDYLLRALIDYKSGKRQNPIMSGQAGGLSKADMQDPAAYFAAQSGLVVKR